MSVNMEDCECPFFDWFLPPPILLIKKGVSYLITKKTSANTTDNLPEAYKSFAKVTAVYANEQISFVAANVCGDIPKFTASYVYYNAGPLYRYIWRQAERRLEVSKKVSEARVTRVATRYFCAARSTLCNKLLSPNLLHNTLQLESIFLQMGVKIKKNQGERARILFQLGVSTFSTSLDLAKKAKQELADFGTTEDAIIARLHWYKSQGALPKSMPDPDKESINRYNLNQKLDEALSSYMGTLAKSFTQKIVPQSVKRGLFGPFYYLEGEYALNSFFQFLMCDCGVKILADPHLLAISTLFGCGFETADYEIDGFGRGKRELLLRTGQAMTIALLEKKGSGIIIELFEETCLKRNPEGIEGIEQKNQAKGAFQDLIKKALSELIGKDTWSSWFVCDNLSQLFAEKGISFLHDPSWRFTLLTLLEALCTEIQDKNYEKYTKEEAKDSVNEVINTLFDHVFEGSTYTWLKGRVTSRAVDAIFSKLEAPVQKETPHWKELLLKGLTPTIKEITLYARILTAFRKVGVEFPGDGKFWELFVRESLLLFIDDQFKDGGERSAVNLSKKREKVIDDLLTCPEKNLLVMLGQVPVDPLVDEMKQKGWVIYDPFFSAK